MKFLYNNKLFRYRRRDLRKTQTKAEAVLWRAIRNEKLNGLKFYRQYSIGPYILDFYCPKIRLGIEIDGESHESPNSKIYDAERSEYLEGADIKIIRFKNEEVISDIKLVTKIILESRTLS